MVSIYLSRILYKIQLVAHVLPLVSIVFKAARNSFSVKEPSLVFCFSSFRIVSFLCLKKSDRSINGCACTFAAYKFI